MKPRYSVHITHMFSVAQSQRYINELLLFRHFELFRKAIKLLELWLLHFHTIWNVRIRWIDICYIWFFDFNHTGTNIRNIHKYIHVQLWFFTRVSKHRIEINAKTVNCTQKWKRKSEAEEQLLAIWLTVCSEIPFSVLDSCPFFLLSIWLGFIFCISSIAAHIRRMQMTHGS